MGLGFTEAEMKAEDETSGPCVLEEAIVGPAVAVGSHRGPSAPLETRLVSQSHISCVCICVKYVFV